MNKVKPKVRWMKKNNKIVAESLKNSGLKQIEFAERLGISRSHLSMIVADTGNASDHLAELVQLKFGRETDTSLSDDHITGTGNTAEYSHSKEAEMEILKDKLILSMERERILQNRVIELQEEIYRLGKPKAPGRKAL